MKYENTSNIRQDVPFHLEVIVLKYTKRIALGLLLTMVVLAVAACSAPPFAWPGLAADGQAVYATLLDGKIHAFDPSNGSELWVFPPQAERKPGLGCTGPSQTSLGLYASPALTEENLFVGSYAGQTYALDRSSGTQRWSFASQEETKGGLAGFFTRKKNPAIIGSPTLDGDTLYIPSADQTLYVVDAASGTRQWDFQAGDAIWASPLVTDDRIYVASMNHKLYCLDKDSQTELWAFDAQGAIPSTPALAGDTVYLGSLGRQVFAVDADTGQLRWSFETGSWAWATPLVISDTVYASEVNGILYALDAESGAKRWDFTAQGKVQATPAYADGTLYLPAEDQNLYALDSVAGTQKWQFTASAALMSTPVMVGDRLYLVGMDNKVYALNAENGTKIWEHSVTQE